MKNDEERIPQPDPTVLSTEALTRGLSAERDYTDGQIAIIIQRLNSVDTATKLLADTVDHVPSVLDREMGHALVLTNEKFASVTEKFASRDVAVAAAFAAQKEAASEQNKANTAAISVSEAATKEAIGKLEQLFTTKTEATNAIVADLKERLARAEERKAGGRQAFNDIYVMVGLVALAVSIVVGALAITR